MPLPRARAGAALAALLAGLGAPPGAAQLEKATLTFDDSRTAAGLRDSNAGIVKSAELWRPAPATTLDELARLNPGLPGAIPALEKMLGSARVSDRFAELYDRKAALLARGGSLAARDYFDCATVLLLENPSSGRRALFVQSDMDVVTDGSDPLRAPELADYDPARSSDWFLPQTAFVWPSIAAPPNPFLAYYPAAVRKLESYKALFEKEAASDKGRIWRRLIGETSAQIARMKEAGLEPATVAALRRSSSLLADRDPFVVLPAWWFSGSTPWVPAVGNYGAVLVGATFYPAIVGDAGPSYKTGEASLRIARELDPRASGRNAPETGLGVTYIVFPGTAAPRETPDLELWTQSVKALLDEFGADTGRLHRW